MRRVVLPGRRIIVLGSLLVMLSSVPWGARAASGPLLLPAGAPAARSTGDGAAGTAGAGEAAAAPAAVPPAPPAGPEPIPVSKIARAADEAQARLRTIKGGLVPSRLERDITAELPSLEGEILRLKRFLEGGAPERLSPRDVRSARMDWGRLDGVVREWEERLEGALSVLQDQQAEVQTLIERWTKTNEDAVAADAPAVVIDRASAVRARATEVDAQFKERTDALLLLQDRIARCRESVIAGIAGTEEALRVYQQALFEIESAPLWTALRTPHPYPFTVGDVAYGIRAFFAEQQGSFRGERGRVLRQMAIFVVLAVGIAVIRRWSREWLETADPAAAKAAVVLSRPLSSAALIVILLSVSSYVAPPVLLRRVYGIVILVPFYRVLPLIVRRRLLPVLYGVGTLWIIARLQDTVLQHSLLERLLMLVITILGLLGLGFGLRPGGPLHCLDASRFGRAVIRGAYVAVALLAVAVISNIVGNVTLAEVMTDGVLGSAFAGVLFYAGAKILEAGLTVLLRSPAIKGLRSLRDHADRLESRWSRAIHAIALFGWVYVTLRTFQVWGSTVEAVSAALTTRLVVGKIDVSLGNFAAFAAALAVAVFVAKVLRIALDDAVLPGLDLPRGIPNAISTTFQYVVVAVGIVLAFLAAGIDMARFGFLAGALGIGIGFGLQNIVSNFVSGLILIYERPVQEGDVIEVGAVRGRVRRIGIRSSTVRTFEGADVVVPNASLLSSEVTNWTLSDQACRAELVIGVAYGTDPRRVIDLLQGIVGERSDIMVQPPPMVLFTGLGDSSLDFAVRFWVAGYDAMLTLKSAVLADIYAALVAEGIEIPFPQRDLHIRSVDEAAGRSLSGEPSVTT